MSLSTPFPRGRLNASSWWQSKLPESTLQAVTPVAQKHLRTQFLECRAWSCNSSFLILPPQQQKNYNQFLLKFRIADNPRTFFLSIITPSYQTRSHSNSSYQQVHIELSSILMLKQKNQEGNTAWLPNTHICDSTKGAPVF